MELSSPAGGELFQRSAESFFKRFSGRFGPAALSAAINDTIGAGKQDKSTLEDRPTPTISRARPTAPTSPAPGSKNLPAAPLVLFQRQILLECRPGQAPNSENATIGTAEIALPEISGRLAFPRFTRQRRSSSRPAGILNGGFEGCLTVGSRLSSTQ